MTKKANTTTKKATVKATPISITVQVSKKNVKTVKATSVCNMWKLNKEIFAEHPEAVLFIKKDGKEFMKLHLVLKSNGKTWMKNDIEESRRKPAVKNETTEVHAIEEADVAETPEVQEAAEA